jgi:cytochrome c
LILLERLSRSAATKGRVPTERQVWHDRFRKCLARRRQAVDRLALKVCGLAIALSAVAGLAEPGAAQDAAAGEKVFLKCRACHQTGENARNSVGPVLNGIVGRKAGTYPDYNYSEANRNSGLTWDEATLQEYLKNPKAKVPETKMTFAGLSSQKDIDNVIAYLKTFGPDGKKL